MFLFSLGLFYWFAEGPWWWCPALFFVPDVSFAAYAINVRVGAFFYNLLHHKGLALLVFTFGYLLEWNWGLVIGSVLFGHSSFDRLLGYGLKYPDSFQNTHLGRIGKQSNEQP